MTTFKDVKIELKNLKHVEHLTNAISGACANGVDLAKCLQASAEIREKYIDAISKLDVENQTILIDSFVNGMSYRSIGRKLSYSEETIKKRVKKSIRQIVEYLNN